MVAFSGYTSEVGVWNGQSAFDSPCAVLYLVRSDHSLQPHRLLFLFLSFCCSKWRIYKLYRPLLSSAMLVWFEIVHTTVTTRGCPVRLGSYSDYTATIHNYTGTIPGSGTNNTRTQLLLQWPLSNCQGSSLVILFIPERHLKVPRHAPNTPYKSCITTTMQLSSTFLSSFEE